MRGSQETSGASFRAAGVTPPPQRRWAHPGVSVRRTTTTAAAVTAAAVVTAAATTTAAAAAAVAALLLSSSLFVFLEQLTATLLFSTPHCSFRCNMTAV